MKIQTQLSGILDELRSALAHIPNDRAEKLADALMGARTIFVAGAGRSGLAMKSFAMRLMHLGFETHVVGETTTPNLTDSDLLLIGSGSGSTESVVVYANKAHDIGATIGLITAVEDSLASRVADVVITVPAPTPKSDRDLGYSSFQPMGSLFEQSLLLILEAIILILMDRKREHSGAMFARHANLE